MNKLLCNNRHPGPNSQTGFSLVELLVVVSLILVVMGAIYGIWLGLGRTYKFTTDDMDAQAQGRAAMAEMVEFIRTARTPDEVAVASYDLAIRDAGPFSITLWTDVNRDATHSLELIRFRVSPDPMTNPGVATFVLYRDQGDATTCSLANPTSIRLVGSNVANKNEGVLWLPTGKQLFTYLDSTGAPLTIDPSTHTVLDPTKIRAVVISLRIDVDPTRSPVVNVLSSVVQPRNLRQ